MTSGWGVLVTPRARRDLDNLDPPVRRRVHQALARFGDTPPRGDVIKLAAKVDWRVRVGDWRVRFRLDYEARLVIVVRVLPRGRAYR